MALQGNLADMSFADLFYLLTRSDKQGVLTVEKDGCQGQLLIYRGEPHAAWISQATHQADSWLYGADAVHHLSTWQSGAFEFTSQPIDPASRNIFVDKRELMLANIFKQQLFGEFQSEPVAAPPINPSHTILARQLVVKTWPDFRAKVNDLDLTMNEYLVLIQVDGKATVEEIATNAKIEVETAWQVIEKLVRLELLEFHKREVAQTSPHSPSITAVTRLLEAVHRQLLSDASTNSNRLAYKPTPAPQPTAIKTTPARPGLFSGIMAKIRSL